MLTENTTRQAQLFDEWREDAKREEGGGDERNRKHQDIVKRLLG